MTAKLGCVECLAATGDPLTAVAGFLPVDTGEVRTWQPCPTCNPDRYAAWQAGTTSQTTSTSRRRRARR